MSDAFETINIEQISTEDSRLSDAGGQGSFLDQFVPMPQVKPGQVGSVVIRILPPKKGGSLFVSTRVHTLNGRKLHCPRPLVNGKWDRNVDCPICDYYSALWRKADKLEDAGHKDEAEKLKNEARSIKPIDRYYYNAVVRTLQVGDDTQKNVGPRILSVGKTLHKMIVRAIVGDDHEEGLGDITNIKAGFDFIIKKELRGTGDNAYPNYDQSKFARDASPAGDPDEIAKWAENLHDLSKLRNVKDMEALMKELAIHRGLVPDESEGFDIEAFDKQYQEEHQGEIDELMSHSDTQVSVPADVVSDDTVSETTEAAAESTVEEPVAVDEDIQIDDEDLLKEIADLEKMS